MSNQARVNLVVFLISLVTFCVVRIYSLVILASNYVTFEMNLVTISRNGYYELVSYMGHFFILNAVEENRIWVVFKRTTYAASCTGIR